jgi:hypothetical protein
MQAEEQAKSLWQKQLQNTSFYARLIPGFLIWKTRLFIQI